MLKFVFKTKGPNLVITNTLAPHTWLSGDRSKDDMLELRQDFFNHYTDILLDHKEKCLHIAVGDFNTRLHARCSGEENILGPFVWGRGETFVKKLTPLDREQRGVLIAALKASEHIRMNSFFEKPDDKKIARSDWSAEGPPYIPTRYAELDAVIANTRTRNMIKNVESNTKHYFPSDHFPLELRLKIKFSKHKGRPPRQVK